MSESANTPTVVLVHGGFADTSFWMPVIKDLQAYDRKPRNLPSRYFCPARPGSPCRA
jgi:hypothetical protein